MKSKLTLVALLALLAQAANAMARTLACVEQFRAMAFTQPTWRESLRGIEASLSTRSMPQGSQLITPCR